MNNKKAEILLRKTFLIISFCLLVLCECSNSKYPYHYPQLTIKYNGQDFETKVNEVTWGETKYENLMIGNSLISVPELDIAKDMDNIDVHINEILTLKLEYDKNISKIYAIEVKGLGEGRKTTPIEIVNNSVKAPEEKGEYVYSVKVIWDSTPESTHFASYVIKLNVI